MNNQTIRLAIIATVQDAIKDGKSQQLAAEILDGMVYFMWLDISAETYLRLSCQVLDGLGYRAAYYRVKRAYHALLREDT